MQTNLLPFLVRNEQKHNILGHYRYEYRTLYTRIFTYILEQKNVQEKVFY